MTDQELLQQAKDQVVNKINLRDMTLYPSFRHLVAKAPRNIVEQASDEYALLAIQSAREEGWTKIEDAIPDKGFYLVYGGNDYRTAVWANGSWAFNSQGSIKVTHYRKLTAPGR